TPSLRLISVKREVEATHIIRFSTDECCSGGTIQAKRDRKKKAALARRLHRLSSKQCSAEHRHHAKEIGRATATAAAMTT
ncbi:hypothetical protein ABTK88_19850, partial [Acinetobacter baumannii]